MLFTINATSQTLATGENVVFNNNSIQTNGTSTHALGTAPISLNCPGVYIIHVTATATRAAAGTATLQLYGNNIEVVGGEASESIAAADDIVNLHFTAAVRVLPNCPALISNLPMAITVQNTGAEITLTNVTMVVTDPRKSW